MNLLTELAVKRPVGVLTVLITLFLFAFNTLTSFKMASMPQMEMPMFILQTMYIGANPDTIEDLLSDPLSEVGQLVEGFDYETTISQENVSTVIFYFDYGTDMDQAYTDLQQEIDRIVLPEDAMDPILIQMSLDSSSIVQLSVSSTIGDDITSFIDDTLVPELETLSGVAEVDVYGVNPGYVSIELDEIAMSQYGISMNQVSSAISGAKFTIPAGEVEQGTQLIKVSAIGELTSLPDIANTPIVTAMGNTIIVDDIAEVKYLQEKIETASRYNGADNLSITVTGTQDADVPAVADTILALCNEITEENSTIKIDVMSNEGKAIVDIIASVAETLLIGVGCCMLVLFIFFGDIKASLIVGSSIPLSLMMALIAMGVSGFELNSITGVALIIAIGMIVDSSIVVLESMFLTKEGKISFVDAAIEGTNIVSSSLVASTITTIVVYLPLAMMAGLSGQLFSQLGYTIVFNMVASILSAVTLVPLAFVLFKPKERKKLPINIIIKFLTTIYEWFVRHFVKWRLMAIINTVLILWATVSVASLVRMEMMPTMDSGYFTITAEFRPGTKMEIIAEDSKIIENMLEADTRVRDYYMRASGNTATIDAYLNPGNVTDDVVNEYKISLNKLSKMSIAVSAGSLTGTMPGTVIPGERSFTIESVRYEDVESSAQYLTEKLYSHPEIIRVNSSVAEGKTQLKMLIDPTLSASYGLGISDVAMQVSMLNSGIDVGEMELSSNEVTMMVEYPDESYNEINEILNAKIVTQRGQVPINDLVDIEFTNEALRIDRSKGKYNITLTAIFDQADTEKINTVIDEILAEDLGTGVSTTDASTEDMMAELQALGEAILIGTFLVFAVMAIQFESFRFSVMVMMSLVFGGIGAFSILLVLDEAVSMTSLMGFLMLVGLAVNNGILYVDTVSQLKKDMQLIDALVEAGKTRIRPIFMTTLTTILSMLPIVFDDGQASQMLKAMALVIIGGLVSSTILILILMPTFYLILDKKKKRMPKKIQRQTIKIRNELLNERTQLEKEEFKLNYELEMLNAMLQNLNSQSKPQDSDTEQKQAGPQYSDTEQKQAGPQYSDTEQKQAGPQYSDTEQKQAGPQYSDTDLNLAEINAKIAELKQRELILNGLAQKLSQKEAIQNAFENKWIAI